MDRQRSETLLRRALLANAGFSTLSASICLAMPAAVGNFMGVASREISSLGLELAAFAIGIMVLLTRDITRGWARNVVAGIIALDVLWVVGSAVLLMSPNPLTTAGQWTVGVVALAVADFAYFQWRGWKGCAATEAAALA